ncbi:MAG: 5'-nucleotidase C-terminal domain-containing protein [Treponema sp.]|nr:5'-nucleotidase C-terminal domain-containing protein [Treponema sp.]
MKIKKLPLVLVTAALAVSVLLAGCASGLQPIKREAGKTYQLVLLHTNDHHGAVLPSADKQGGLAERATFIQSVKKDNPNVLLVDAGDINTGTALSNMFNAEVDFKAYNIMGYDAATFGNHEFDGNMAKLTTQLGLATFPFVSSNIMTSDGKFLGGHQYLVKNYEGFRVGIIGITTLRTKEIATPDKSLIFLPEIEAAKAAVALLKNVEKVDIVIALAHMGSVKEAPNHVISSELAAAVTGIDIIVDGHSHTYMKAPQKVGNTYIVSANEWGKYVGDGKLSIVDGKLTGFDWTAVEINNKDKQTYAADPVIAALIAPYKTKADASLKEVIGQAADDFIFGNRLTRYQETALGNMINDANVWYFKTVYNQNIDFAFHNGGNFRAPINKGPITTEAVLTVLPFANYLYVISMKGSDLQQLFNFIGTIAQGAGGFPQFSKEVRFTIDKTPGQDKGTVSNITIGGQPIDPNKTYRFCTNDYILNGGDGYTVVKDKAQSPFNTSLLLSFVVSEYIKNQKTITPAMDGRLNVIGGTTP